MAFATGIGDIHFVRHWSPFVTSGDKKGLVALVIFPLAIIDYRRHGRSLIVKNTRQHDLIVGQAGLGSDDFNFAFSAVYT